MTSAYAGSFNHLDEQVLEESGVSRAHLSVVDKQWREKALAELLDEVSTEVYGQALVETSSTAAASRITNRVVDRSERWLRLESMPTARALREHVLYVAYVELERYRRLEAQHQEVRFYRGITRHLMLAGATAATIATALVALV
jgi:hypothetical protein